MNQMNRIILSTVAFSLVSATSAISGPCCMNASKECAAKKQCASPKKECPVKKSCDSTRTPDNIKNTAPDRTILFFMNPNGRPCQMQLAVLDGMKEKLVPLAAITYIKTTESSDRDKFARYGIRGLPSLIIADKNGKEITRFQPGIQDEAAILHALEQKTQ